MSGAPILSEQLTYDSRPFTIRAGGAGSRPRFRSNEGPARAHQPEDVFIGTA